MRDEPMQDDHNNQGKNKEIENAQRYVKLTRGLILKRILTGELRLDPEQREKMEGQLASIRLQLGLSESEFDEEVRHLSKNAEGHTTNATTESTVSSSTTATATATATAYCLNRKCRHHFTVAASSHGVGANPCPQCGGPTMFVLGEPQ